VLVPRDPEQPLAVSAELDPLALPETALLVADLLDAKVVHLCEGESCARDREILARRYAVLVVDDGEALALPTSADCPRRSGSNGSSRHSACVALATAESGPVLHVPEASAPCGRRTLGGRSPSARGPARGTRASASPAPETVAVQHATIVRPWFRAWESGSEDALRLAAGRAREGGIRGLRGAQHLPDDARAPRARASSSRVGSPDSPSPSSSPTSASRRSSARR
jgi:hypothetical protein